MKTTVFCAAALLLMVRGVAAEPSPGDETAETSAGSAIGPSLSDPDGLDSWVKQAAAEQHEFYGLAGYYNNVEPFVLTDGVAAVLERDVETLLKEGQWLAFKGRLRVAAVQAPGLVVSWGEKGIHVHASPPTSVHAKTVILPKSELDSIPGLDALRYSHLFAPFAALARGVEWILVFIHELGFSNWGGVIIVFSVLLKLLLLPLSLMTVRLQRQVSQCTSQLAPRIAEIKSEYSGEEAHRRIMEAHEALGVTPFYTLKPLASSLVQVPILIAIFNALGEMPQLAGASFLWIDDLAYPDSIASLPMAIPLFGAEVSLLPLAMTAITVGSTLIFRNSHALPAELKAQKRNLYLMAVAFFVLFYPFPAAMVLFWTLANVLQTIQQQVVKL